MALVFDDNAQVMVDYAIIVFINVINYHLGELAGGAARGERHGGDGSRSGEAPRAPRLGGAPAHPHVQLHAVLVLRETGESIAFGYTYIKLFAKI